MSSDLIKPYVLGLTLLCVLLSITFPQVISIADLWIFVVVMVSVGIPHGAIDHVIYKHFRINEDQKRINWWYFYASYILCLLIFGVSWFLIPLISLIAFILLSAYHFGQAHLFGLLNGKSSLIKITAFFAWGITLIFGLLSFQFQHLVDSFQMETLFPDINNWQSYIFTIHMAFLVITIGLIMGLTLTRIISGRRGIMEMVILVLLHGLYYVAPPLTSFAIFFGLWHSLPVMIQEYTELKDKNPGLSVGDFIQKLIPYSLISFLGIALLIGFAGYWKDLISPFMLFFIGLSALTFPHVFYMARFYLSISSSNKKYPRVHLSEKWRRKTA